MKSRLFLLTDETGRIRVARVGQLTRSKWEVALPGGAIYVECEAEEVETVLGMYGEDLREWSDRTGRYERLSDRYQLPLSREGVA